MSTLKTNNVQVGQSATATNNFTLYQPSTPDGTVRLGVGNTGATTADVITVNNSGNVGIGTSSPSFPLDVAGNMRANAWIGRVNGSAPTADCAVYRPADGTLGFSTTSTERARIDNNGNWYMNSGYGSVAVAYGLPRLGELQRNGHGGYQKFRECDEHYG